MVYRDLADSEMNEIKEKINVCKSEDCFDKSLTHIEKRKPDAKKSKDRIMTRNNNKIIAH